MSVFIPTSPGGTISASDSDSITSDVDVGGLPPSSRVWNVDVGAFFVLTVSTASLVTDEILAVKGITGMRWIKDNSGVYAPASANLTDADQTIQPLTDHKSRYVMQPGVQTADRIVTVGVTGSPSIQFQHIQIARPGGENFTLTIKNNAGTTLVTIAAGVKAVVDVYNTGEPQWLFGDITYVTGA